MPQVDPLYAFAQIIAAITAAGVQVQTIQLPGLNIPFGEIVAAMQEAGFLQVGGTASNVFTRAIGVNGGNGMANVVADVTETTIIEDVVTETTTVTATAKGAGLLAMDVGLAGAAIAPALGLVSGVALYNLTPSFWDAVAEKLMAAGYLVKGKIEAILKKDGTTALPQGAIEIYKNAFLNAGLFEDTYSFPAEQGNVDINIGSNTVRIYKDDYNGRIKNHIRVVRQSADYGLSVATNVQVRIGTEEPELKTINPYANILGSYNEEQVNIDIAYDVTSAIDDYTLTVWPCAVLCKDNNDNIIINAGGYAYRCVLNGVTKYIMAFGIGSYTRAEYPEMYNFYKGLVNDSPYAGTTSLFHILMYSFFNMVGDPNPNVQPDADIPSEGETIPETYPDWHPSIEIGDEPYLPTSMPKPDAAQDPQQTGQNDQEQQQPIIDTVFDPSGQLQPDFTPEGDPQAIPEPFPELNPEPVPDPPDPNPEPTDSEIPAVLPTLDTFSADSMFCVYNPTDGQVNALGQYLWDANIITQIRNIWTNPLDCVISLHKIYGAPVTGGTQEILLGYLHSGVSAKVVTNQFVTVDCGYVDINENKNNATDYSPFTQVQIYLPFVGIQELDTNEIMNGRLHVIYKIDAYTGTCLALVYCKRNPDMTTEQLLYTFPGNASQKIPLTSGDFGGALSSLLSVVGVGIATGGNLVAAAATGAAHSLTSDMVHVQHSGGLSANSGLMGPRVPFVIISRQYGYDASSYNTFYGYPANKTTYLSNCSGFTKVKEMNYQGNGTQKEKDEIISLLQDGILI